VEPNSFGPHLNKNFTHKRDFKTLLKDVQPVGPRKKQNFVQLEGCSLQLVLNVERNVKFLSNLKAKNLFTVMNVTKNTNSKFNKNLILLTKISRTTGIFGGKKYLIE
jgi:hypothetical protein